MIAQGKVPPNATDLEEAILGACMLEEYIIPDIIDILKPESFYKIEHQKVFNAIVSLSETDSPVDILTVSNFLKKEGTLDLVGGPYFVSQLTERVAAGTNAEFHARIVQQKYLQREIIRISGDVYNEAYEDTADVIDLLDSLNEQLAALDSNFSKDSTKTNLELVNKVISDSEAASQGGDITGLTSEVRAKDKLTGGSKDGSFLILAARPAMGKSALALQEAYHIGVTLNLPCDFYSLEMPSHQLMLRMMSHHLGIAAWKIEKGKLDSTEWNILNKGVQEIIDSKLNIIDHLSGFHDICRSIKKNHRKHGTRMAFIDYLQLMGNKQEKGNREQEISSMSRGLKLLAKSLDVPILALSQLSRSVETRGGTKRPMLSDLRESGSLEQDADQVAFLYRPEYYGLETDEEYGDTHGLTEYILAKNRSGATGTAPMKFNGETTSFSDWEEQSFTAPPSNDIPETVRSTSMQPSKSFDIDDIDNGMDNEDYF